MVKTSLIALSGLAATANAKVYFKEQFNDDGWKDRWTVSSWKDSDSIGEWVATAGKWHGEDASDMGLQTSEDSRFYGLSAPLAEAFDNKDKDLVIQMSVKHEQKLDCGGAYIKLLGELDQSNFGGDSPYDVMFGPDICGTGTRKTHAIFNYNDENLLINKDVRCETDQLSHLYTLHVKAEDNTFDILIDNKSVKKGDLKEHWDFLLPEEIKDPEQSKPGDWVDEKKIPDPEASKPDGWDDIPAEIPDPEAEKPEDWDDEDDGEWEPPMIDNPEYKGEWEHPQIDNPEYKGEWEHPMIANPDFVDDPALHHRCHNCQHIGFELWQVKAGTIFDDIIVTDDIAEAQAFAEETFFAKKDAEKAMFDEIEQERKDKEKAEREEKEAERKAKKEAEEAAKAAEEEEDDDEEEYDDGEEL